MQEITRLTVLPLPDRSIEVGNELQATLCELLDLTLLGKQLRWSVVGTSTVSLQRQLDAMAAVWSDLADDLAERAVAVGFWPDGQAGAIMDEPERVAVPRGPLDDHRVVSEIAYALMRIGERARVRSQRVGAADPAASEVLAEVVRTLESQLSLSRAQHPVVSRQSWAAF